MFTVLIVSLVLGSVITLMLITLISHCEDHIAHEWRGLMEFVSGAYLLFAALSIITCTLAMWSSSR